MINKRILLQCFYSYYNRILMLYCYRKKKINNRETKVITPMLMKLANAV